MRNFWVGLIVLGTIICTIWFQLNIFNLIPFFGVTANVGIVLVVALGILCGQGIGIAVGITYGVICDILLGKSFGIYTLLFFLVGFFCGKISHGFSKENKSSIIMIAAAATVLFEIGSYLLFTVIYRYDFMIFNVIWCIILESIYNIFIASILFKALSFLAEIINKGKSSYYLL